MYVGLLTDRINNKLEKVILLMNMHWTVNLYL